MLKQLQIFYLQIIPYNKNHERSELRGNHNNFNLFVIILLMGFGKWIYLSRLFYIYEGSIKYDIIPFVYEIETIKSFCLYGNEQKYENCTINHKNMKIVL